MSQPAPKSIVVLTWIAVVMTALAFIFGICAIWTTGEMSQRFQATAWLFGGPGALLAIFAFVGIGAYLP